METPWTRAAYLDQNEVPLTQRPESWARTSLRPRALRVPTPQWQAGLRTIQAPEIGDFDPRQFHKKFHTGSLATSIPYCSACALATRALGMSREPHLRQKMLLRTSLCQTFVDEEYENLQWPLLDEVPRPSARSKLVVEPGELHQETCEFIISSEVKSVLVYTYFHNSWVLHRIQGSRRLGRYHGL